jgi:hypothetical protein
VREFHFELALCAHLERERPESVVARQLGGGVESRRILDSVVVEPGDGFDRRRAITPERIPAPAIESDVGPGRSRYWKPAFDIHPERAEAVVERAVELGFFERERRNGRTYVRQTTRYPDWVDRVVGVENKPDLDRPGDLRRQLRVDVSLGLLDEVWLATESYVTGAHLNRIPDAVGVWRFDPETGERETVREATVLDPDAAGVEVLEERPGRTDVAVVSPGAKARMRRRLAERAYGKGWRTYAMPACENAAAGDCAGTSGLPYCAYKGRFVDAASECGPDCGGYRPADAPETDPERERARRTPWDPDPDGLAREQARLGQFGEE